MPISNQISHIFSELALWKHFTETSGATTQQIALVEEHIDFAMPLLDQYIKAFPKYTLHNHRHQVNIIKLMGDLLGDHVNELTSLECAMLILSTIYHDIGMVYSKTELENIVYEPEFKKFLIQNTKAQLEYEENGQLPTEGLVEWYCRWMHAKRVWVYLDKSNVLHPLRWKSSLIKEQLGHLCESHNMGFQDIISDLDNFPNSYQGECDLLFCAILLRLADILDFDNTRSPKSVYEFLDLDNPKNNLDSYSQIEWQKHLNSDGFKFKRDSGNLKVLFSASTPHPNIEVAMRSFIQTINSELRTCKKLQKLCSEKWRLHTLPDEINVENLKSENYQSGNYHFSLSEEKILNLLTGDGLYNDDFIFIRELLQNAIDTSRHRAFHETMTNTSFKPDPIQVSLFTDKQGYQWVRIDDYGMGMNDNIILNHLLKKGDSYYNSDKFKLEKININKTTKKDFVPISRFGIGLLSCFMAGDRIEISTKHYSDPDDAFRLGIEGRNSSYILQSSAKKHNPRPMPAEFNDSEGYRTKPGTSIAVRITTNKEYVGFDMKSTLERFILSSPVPITYKGENIGGDFDDLIHKPWAKNEVVIIDKEFVETVEKSFKIKFKDGIKVNIENIDITSRSLSENLKGQFLFIAVDADYDDLNILRPDFILFHDSGKLVLKIFRTENIERKKTDILEELDISYILEKIHIPEKLRIDSSTGAMENYVEGIALSHNGILINDENKIFALERNLINEKLNKGSLYFSKSFTYSGIFYFQDELLPSLTVSRNEIKELSFEIVANLSFSLEPLNKYIDSEYEKFNFFKSVDLRDGYTSQEIRQSGFYLKNQRLLNDYIKIDTFEGTESVDSLRKIINQKTEFEHISYHSNFYLSLVNFVIEQNFAVSMHFENPLYQSKYFINKRVFEFPKELEKFEPLSFLTFDNHVEKLGIGVKLNINHNYIQWYMKAVDLLDREYFYYSRQLIYCIFRKDIKMIQAIFGRLESVLPDKLKPSEMVSISEKDFSDEFNN